MFSTLERIKYSNEPGWLCIRHCLACCSSCWSFRLQYGSSSPTNVCQTKLQIFPLRDAYKFLGYYIYCNSWKSYVALVYLVQKYALQVLPSSPFSHVKGQSNQIFNLQFFVIIRTSLGHWPMGKNIFDFGLKKVFTELFKFFRVSYCAESVSPQ